MTICFSSKRGVGLLLLALGACQPTLDAGNWRMAPPMQVKHAENGPDRSAETPHTGYYQLVLSNEAPTSSDLSTLKQVYVQHNPARTLGELLTNLYLPAGSGGTPESYLVMYASAQEWNASAEIVKKLDVPPTSDDTTTFTQAIRAYCSAVSDSAEPAIWESVLNELKHVAANTDETALRKWTASMIAGAIATDRLYARERAEQMYQLAETSADPGSLEQMNAIYRRARTQLEGSDIAGGRRLLAQIIGQFPTFRRSESFERARQRLELMDRAR